MIIAKNVIILPEKYTEMELYAATELRKYLTSAFGNSFPIESETAECKTQPGKIYVGATKETAAQFSEMESLQQDEFIVSAKEGNLYVFGKENVYSQAPTLYGVYDFLEREIGVRFYSHDEEYIPTEKEVQLKDFYRKESPSFLIRQPLYCSTRKNPTFTAKLRIKDCYCKGTPGGELSPMWAGSQGHNFFKLIPPKEYQESHPEWFDLENSELCFSQESLTDEIFEKIKQQILDKPHSKFFALSQNDTVKPCQCEACKKGYEKYGESGMLIRFVNRVAKQIEEWAKKECPEREIYLVTFAYYFSIKPPVDKVDGKYIPKDESCIPNKNVYIFFTTIDFCFWHSLTDSDCEWNKDFLDTYMGWKSLVGERMMVWNYCINYAHYLYPFYNFNTIKGNYKFFKDNGVNYLLDHGSCEGEYVEMSELRTYLSAKLMWNVDLDVETLTSEFIDGYYKAAAPQIKQYLQALESHFKKIDEKQGYHLRLYHLPTSMFDYQNFPIEFLNKLFAVLDEGLQKAASVPNAEERKKLCERVLRVRVSAKYLLLMNYDKYGLEGKEKFLQDFLADCKECGIKKYKECWSPNRSDFISDLVQEARENKVLYFENDVGDYAQG